MILALLGRLWPYLAIALLSFGLYASIKQNGKISAQLDSAIQISNANALVAEQERKDREKADQKALEVEKRLQVSHKRYAGIKQQVIDAKPQDDGPVAPVLQHVLSQLRGPHPNPDQADESLNSPVSSHVSGSSQPSRP